jgi:hypothetical protein
MSLHAKKQQLGMGIMRPNPAMVPMGSGKYINRSPVARQRQPINNMSPSWTLSLRVEIGREISAQSIITASFCLVSMHSKVIFRPSRTILSIAADSIQVHAVPLRYHNESS